MKLLSEMVRKEGYNQWESRCGRGGWRETTVDLNPVLPPTVTGCVTLVNSTAWPQVSSLEYKVSETPSGRCHSSIFWGYRLHHKYLDGSTEPAALNSVRGAETTIGPRPLSLVLKQKLSPETAPSSRPPRALPRASGIQETRSFFRTAA